MTGPAQSPVVIWRLVDGKPGHENQTLGLAYALRRELSCEIHEIPVRGRAVALLYWLFGFYPPGRGLPSPDLILGAGHTTHLHLLAAKKAAAGRTVVLMRPSLPVSWFDLTLIPGHDEYRGGGVYLETSGVLNAFDSDGVHDKARSLATRQRDGMNASRPDVEGE